MQIILVREIQLFKGNRSSFIVLIDQGSGEVLTQITTFIKPHRYERHHRSKLLAYTVVIVMDESNSKHAKGDKQVIHDAMQRSHGHSVYSSRYSSQTESNSHSSTRESSVDIYFH